LILLIFTCLIFKFFCVFRKLVDSQKVLVKRTTRAGMPLLPHSCPPRVFEDLNQSLGGFMKPKSIGVIGGAGPSAGVFFLERLFSLARQKYGCHKDADFPQLFLISFPFSEMLEPYGNFTALQGELRDCLHRLRQNKASVLAIACNTLHAFLDAQEDHGDLIHMPRVLGESMLLADDIPLVLCTSTSVQAGLHKQFFPCVYPDSVTQVEVDRIIDRILKGDDLLRVHTQLEALIDKQAAKKVVLGCTELSLFASQLACANKLIIDPLEILAEEVLKTSFNNMVFS
jgi:aspartate racemase